MREGAVLPVSFWKSTALIGAEDSSGGRFYLREYGLLPLSLVPVLIWWICALRIWIAELA